MARTGLRTTHVLLEDFMRTAATIVGAGLVALALAGCSTSTPAPATTHPTPTPTGRTLGAPAVGDGGRIAFALKNDTVGPRANRGAGGRARSRPAPRPCDGRRTSPAPFSYRRTGPCAHTRRRPAPC